MLSSEHIGFIQDCLSLFVNKHIQAFLWDCWQVEFTSAKKNGLGLMEWTLDQERLY